MKMKLWKRVTVMALAVLGVLTVISTLLEALGCGFSESLRDFVSTGEGKYNALNLYIFIVACGFLITLCVSVFMIAFNSGRVKKARLITLEDNNGDCILLSQDTLDSLVHKAIGEPLGVSDIKVETGYQDGRVEAMVDIAVNSNINIPKTTRDLQERVRHQVADLSGICVNRVNVTISTIKVPEDGESALPADALKPAPAEPKAEETAAAEEKADDEYTVKKAPVIEVPPQVELPTPRLEADSEEISEETADETADEAPEDVKEEEQSEPENERKSFFSPAPEVDFDADETKYGDDEDKQDGADKE